MNLSGFFSDREQVTFYPTYGCKESDNWVIPIRVWVHEDRDLAEAIVTTIAGSLAGISSAGIGNFRHRIRDFVADSESGEAVRFRFDHDPEDREYAVEDDNGASPKTDVNGLIKGVIRIPIAKAAEILVRQGSKNGWLKFHASSKDHSGAGRARLVEPAGISVISDIDDTIKITEVPAGRRAVVVNTFFRDFLAAPGMAEIYRDLGDPAFHYVSGSPWQLYRPLAEFLFRPDIGFPEGTFHMRNVRKNLLSADSWEDLKDLAVNENATFEQKIAQISEIVRRFPARKFILIGDSGEKDPEVYRKIATDFPTQVIEIRIRDVVGGGDRLKGMTIIPAPIINPA